jgi:hypothetical protein
MSRCSLVVFPHKLAGSSRSSALCTWPFQLLLIYDVEAAFSVLAAALAAVGACCLLVRSARSLCHDVQSFTDGWTVRRAVTATVSGHVDGYESSSDDFLRDCPVG